MHARVHLCIHQHTSFVAMLNAVADELCVTEVYIKMTNLLHKL